jgi:hypothetical protein
MSRLGDASILRKRENKVARCTLVTHPLGWELRLMIARAPQGSGNSTSGLNGQMGLARHIAWLNRGRRKSLDGRRH